MYSPKIDSRQVQRLYRLKQERGLPMTALVKEAIEQYLAVEEEKEMNTCPECGGEETYLVSYCNFPHCINCGAGLDHEGCWFPPEALRAEREGDFERARAVLEKYLQEEKGGDNGGDPEADADRPDCQ